MLKNQQNGEPGNVISFHTKCIIDQISELDANSINKSKLGDIVKSCSLPNNTQIEGFAGVTTNPQSICFDYGAIIWLIIIVLIVVILVIYS